MDLNETIETSLEGKAASVLDRYRAKGWTLVLAESCTGGLLAAALTSIAGSSAVVERGFVTYSNEAKTELLGVPAPLIARHGAVSAEVASAMTEGALAHSPATAAASVTGIAGPDGATPGKPVGTVFIAAQRRGNPARVERFAFSGNRSEIRQASVAAALALLAGLHEG